MTHAHPLDGVDLRSRVQRALDDHLDWLRTDVLPRADGEWAAGPERFEEMIRLRELERTMQRF